MRTIRWRLFFTAAALLLPYGLSIAQLIPFGLTEETVLSLAAEREDYPNVFSMSNTIVAGTVNKGVFIVQPYDTAHLWKQYGLAGRKIQALTLQHWGAGPRDGLTILAGVEALTGALRAEIFRRPLPIMFPEDSVWIPADSGLDKERIGSINALAAYYYTGHTPPQPVLAGMSYGVLHGYPAGTFWGDAVIDKLASVNALDVQPYWFGTLAWAAGRLGLAPAAFHSFDNGQTWQTHLLPSAIEGEAFSVAIHPQSPDTVFVGSRNALWMTPDSGRSWQIALAAPCLFSALAIDAINPMNIYTGGSAPGNEGCFYRSSNTGKNWERILPFTGDTMFGVTSLAVVNEESQNNPDKRIPAVFLGTNGTGVWKYHPQNTTDVDRRPFVSAGTDVLSCYPNPVRDYISLTISVRKSQQLRVCVTDILGRNIRTLENLNLVAGSNLVSFPMSGLPTGAYTVSAFLRDGMRSQRIHVVR